MKFEEVHKLIPYLHDGELHSVITQIYPAVRVRQPGRHAFDTDPIGGDFVVEVTCSNAGWDVHPFTHADIFRDIENKTLANSEFMQKKFALAAAGVVSAIIEPVNIGGYGPGLDFQVLLQTTQVLAVAEDRRYGKYNDGGGGKFLPLRFAIGIIYGHWTAEDAIKVQRRGIHGYRELTKQGGNPPTVKRLLNG